MSATMSSRERVLGALRRQPVDYVPCAPSFNALTPVQRLGHRYQFPWGPSQLEQVEYLAVELGVDPVVRVPAGDYYPAPEVTSRAWLDGGVIHKVWATPSGELHAAVNYNQAWPHGLDIPFFSDFNAGHYVEPWIKTRADVECLRHILLPARTSEQLEQLRFAYGEAAAQADSYLELEHRKNLRDLEIALDLGADIVNRNGFYETADYYSPAMLERFLWRRLNAEARLVREAGAVSTYTVHTGVMPMLDYLDTLQFDCLMYLAVSSRGVHLEEISARLSHSKSFWTGPDNTHDMWSADTEVVREAVRRVFRAFGPRGLVLTAASSAHPIMPWENTLAMVDEWKRLR